MTKSTLSRIAIVFVLCPLACLVLASCSNDNIDDPVYLKVIERIRLGSIKADKDFNAELPADCMKASVDGQIYIVHGSAGQLIVIFKTWAGKGGDMKGFLYSDKPLAPADIHKDSYGNSVFLIRSYPLVLEKHLNPNWYQVSNSMS